MKEFLCSSAVAAFLAITAATGQSAATAEKLNDKPEWLRNVAAIRSGDAESFQFRASFEVNSYHQVAYVSFIPPNRQCVVVCDGADNFPLMVATDGNVWVYDLIGGQILHCEGKPFLEAFAVGDRFDCHWGFKAPEEEAGINVDCASLFRRAIPQKDFFDFASPYGRVVASSGHDLEAHLLVTSADPPRPQSFLVEHREGDRLLRSRFGSFQFGAPPPDWHRPLDSKLLAGRLPFLHLESLNHVPAELQPWVDLFKNAKTGSSAFILRPALHNPALRGIVAEEFPKLDFQQIEAHEKLLHDPWLRALKEQDFDPAKGFPSLSPPPNR